MPKTTPTPKATRNEIQARAIIPDVVDIVKIRIMCFIHGMTWENPDDFMDEKSVMEHEAKTYKINVISHMGQLLYQHRWIINPTKEDRRFRISAEGERFIHDAYAKLNAWQTANGMEVTPNPEDSSDTEEAAKIEKPRAERAAAPATTTPARRPGTPA